MQDPHVVAAAVAAARLRSSRRALRAVDYLRVSTEEQAKGYGVAYSGKKTAGYISQKDWEHVGTFVDEGVSGALESRQRPELRRLMEQAWNVPRPFDIVVVNEGRAIGRTGRAFWRWVWELQEIGIFVAVVKRDYDNSTPEGESKMRKDADYAEDEREIIRERTQGGIQEKAESGGYIGGKVPYGYRVRAGRLVLDECRKGRDCAAKHEACALRRGRVLYAELGDWSQAALAMNSEGLRRRDGGLWGGQSLRQRVLNPIVLEARQAFRSSAGVRRDHEGRPVNGDRVVIPLPPIFTRAEVEELRASSVRPVRTLQKARPYTLSGRIVSPCGKRYIGGGTTRGKVYRCQGRTRAYAGAPVCSCPYLAADAVEEQTWRRVRMLLGDADRLKAMAGVHSESPAAQRDGSGERRGELDRQIRIHRQALAIALGVAAKEVAASDLGLEESEKAVERQIAPLQTELRVLLDARRELRNLLAASDAVREQSAQLVELAATTRRMWSDLPLARQKELMATLEVEVTFIEPQQQGRKGQRCALTEWFTDRRLKVPVLTDEGWAVIEPMITHRPRRVSPRLVMTGILYKARTGISWSALPDLFGCPITLRTYAARWRESGFWEDAMRSLAAAEGTPLPESNELKTRIGCSVEPRKLLKTAKRGSLNTSLPDHDRGRTFRFRLEL
ncbi:recombinase family protein [Streptomyces sp. NPDC088755]|uniref:recombinase family protein n=1 Tax=Streptomyces sp. NPDC088755 TaxID=3365888 RepID=UPI0038186FB7